MRVKVSATRLQRTYPHPLMTLPRIALLLGLLVLSPVSKGSPAEPTATSPSLKWEKEINAIVQSERVTPPPKDALLFIGSSTIRRWKTLATDFPGYAVINHGFGGSQIADATFFADQLIFPCQPRMILLRAGGNDLHAGKSATQVFNEFKEFESTVHAILPGTDIVFISLCPVGSRITEVPQTRELNSLVATFVKTASHVKYLEAYDLSLGADGAPRPELFVDDQLHFNEEGYKLLAERVRTFLQSDAFKKE